jgi:hypothetical protein
MVAKLWIGVGDVKLPFNAFPRRWLNKKRPPGNPDGR